MLKTERMAIIVDAAIAEFLEKGYEAASMEGIALRAGLTKGGLYHHFPGKDALLVFANQQLAEPAARILSGAQRKADAAAGLVFYIEGYIRFWAKRTRQMEFFFLTMTKLRVMTQALEAYSAYYRETVAVVAGMYRRGIEAGVFRKIDFEATATSLVSALDGALGMMLLDRGRKAAPMAASLRSVFVDELLAGH